MREYAFHATDETIAALRRLRAPWAGWHRVPEAVTVRLADGARVRLSVEGADVEPGLEAQRVAAAVLPDESAAEDAAADERAPGPFAAGGNDVVVFHGVTWTESGGDSGQSFQLSGRLGLQPDTAEAACVTTDAVVLATTTGEGLLIRLAARPYTLEVVEDRVEIGRFLVQRGYSG